MSGNIISLSILVLAIIAYYLANEQYKETVEQLNKLEKEWERRKADTESLYQKTVRFHPYTETIETLSVNADITDIPVEKAPEELIRVFMDRLAEQIVPFIKYDIRDNCGREVVKMSIRLIKPTNKQPCGKIIVR
jgi:hypothetical protein